jgi:hypothetical protein
LYNRTSLSLSLSLSLSADVLEKVLYRVQNIQHSGSGSFLMSRSVSSGSVKLGEICSARCVISFPSFGTPGKSCGWYFIIWDRIREREYGVLKKGVRER